MAPTSSFLSPEAGQDRERRAASCCGGQGGQPRGLRGRAVGLCRGLCPLKGRGVGGGDSHSVPSVGLTVRRCLSALALLLHNTRLLYKWLVLLPYISGGWQAPPLWEERW